MNFVTPSWVDLDGFLDVSRRHDYRASEQLPRRCIHPNTTQLFKIFKNYITKKTIYKKTIWMLWGVENVRYKPTKGWYISCQWMVVFNNVFLGWGTKRQWHGRRWREEDLSAKLNWKIVEGGSRPNSCPLLSLMFPLLHWVHNLTSPPLDLPR